MAKDTLTKTENDNSPNLAMQALGGTPDATNDDKPDGAVEESVELEESNSRTLRASEEREDQEREMIWAPARLLPTPNPVDGMDFKYVRVTTPNGIDNINHSQALRAGWQPIMAEEVPELGVIMSDVGSVSGNVVFGGMMLCKRPSHIGDRIKQIAAEQSRAQVEAVDRGYLNDQNSAMQKFSDKQSRVQFGNGS